MRLTVMENNKKDSDFDFDQWAAIARQDPEQFERMRQQLIAGAIAQSPEHLKQRMEGLQWQIDQIRKQSSNPMASCLRISQEMWGSVLGERGLLKALQEPGTIPQSLNKDAASNIIPLRKRRIPDGE